MFLFAHELAVGNGFMDAWEIHPALVHFPIAFFLGGLLLGVYAAWRRQLILDQIATGLLIAGVVLGLVTGLAGLLALFTLPEAHTEQAHTLMYWHLGLQVTAVVLFAACAWLRWRAWSLHPGVGARLIGWVGAVVLVVGSWMGGYIVYHGGAGIDPDLISQEVREEHHHGGHGGHATAHAQADHP